ncbi:CHAT domain-containing protein [Trichoderma pleuroticola]
MFREAISLMEEAISTTAEDNVLDRVKYLSQLSQMYALRHNRVVEISDLEYAIKYADQAINEGPDPESYEGYARLPSDISDMHMAKFEYTGQIAALRDGINNAEKALSISGDQNSEPDPILLAKLAENYLLPRIWNGLAAVLAQRYERRPEHIHDFREAVTLIRNAINATSTKDVVRVSYLLNFAYRLCERFALDQDTKDLHDGIQAVDEAINLDLLGHPRFLDMLRCRAKLLSALFYVTRDPRHYTKAEDNKVDLVLLKEKDGGRSTQLWWATEICCQAMNDCPNSAPLDRLKAAYKASLYLEMGDCSMAGGLLCRGIDLLPRLNPRSLSRDDQQFLLRQSSAMVSDAAACLLEVTKQPARALAILESGRGVIASLMVNSRSDVSDLQHKDNSLYNRYIELRDAVSRNINEFSNATSTGGAASEKAVANALSRRVQDEHDLHLVEENIRRLDVIFNIAKWRSDATIAPKHPSTGIRYVSLLGLKYDELGRFTPWVTGKEKIDLGVNTKQWSATDELPRIWWAMSGIMSVFPLHAVGEDWGGESSFESAASHVVSSYIPTIKALKYARDKNVSNLSEQDQSFLIASMPETEGMRPLRVSGEVAAVKPCATSFPVDKVVAVDTPSKELVLEELKSTRIVHFICHGALDINNLSDRCLLFKQDVDDGKAERLRVRDVAALSMEHAYIAYLSACSTVETEDKTLVDETIHLASSFQLVGFPHVIGTTWEANNIVAEKISKNFYTHN